MQCRSQEWPRKTSTFTYLSEISLSLWFIHLGSFLLFTLASQGEGGNDRSVFKGTSLWNVAVFKNILRLHIQYIWILNYFWSGRKGSFIGISIWKGEQQRIFKIYVSNGHGYIYLSIIYHFICFFIHLSVSIIIQDACQCQLLGATSLFLDLPFSVSTTLETGRLCFLPVLSKVSNLS